MKHPDRLSRSLSGFCTLFFAPHGALVRDGFCDRDDPSLSAPALNSRAALEASGYTQIDAEIPNAFEHSLFAAGLLPDPDYDVNIFALRDCERMHQFYVRNFGFSGDPDGQILTFHGIDTAAEVFLNGARILVCENMFLEYPVPVSAFLREGQNELVIHIKPATVYARQYDSADMRFALQDNYESLHLRKAASSFGWDIMPRTPAGGVWRDITLDVPPRERIDDFFGYTMQTDPAAGAARLGFSYAIRTDADSLSDLRLEIVGICGSHSFSCGGKISHTCGRFTVDLSDVCFWMPRPCGEPSLYTVTAVLRRGERILDRVSFRLGIRTVELIRSSVVEENGTPEGAGDFCFLVNGQRIFAMGTNWVPLDAFHFRDRDRLPQVLPMLTDLGCNMVRLWGGNVYEDEALFDFCDENGILIWQDFAMGCGVYPQDEAMQNAIRVEAEQIVRRYRNHPSLALWAGDNECDTHCNFSRISRDPNRNLLTRKVIPEVLFRLDLTRPYLPSSPYLDETAYATGQPTPEDHLWGPRDWFKGSSYADSRCRFASEIGYHGCPSPHSLSRFLSPAHLFPWRREATADLANDGWLAHACSSSTDADAPYAYRIPLMAKQVRNLFGEEPCDLAVFARESQISQAEALKYFIEHFRIGRAWRTGILWWNLTDGWPQISDAVVDRYGVKKLAYGFIKRSQQPLALMCDEPRDGLLKLVVVNDYPHAEKLTYTVTTEPGGNAVLTGSLTAPPESATGIGALPFDAERQIFYRLAWQTESGARGENHYVCYRRGNLRRDDYLAGLSTLYRDTPAFDF